MKYHTWQRTVNYDQVNKPTKDTVYNNRKYRGPRKFAKCIWEKFEGDIVRKQASKPVIYVWYTA